MARRAQALTAVAFAAVYLAVLSGHLYSMDGLYVERQAHALAIDHSIRFKAPLWTFKTEPTWNSNYGIGSSLLYVPGMILGSAMAASVPVSVDRPHDAITFYFRALYEDRLYTVGASWVFAIVVALTAFLVARLTVALGFSARAGLWAMAFYGLGSSALVYSRGDFAQPIEGLCWTAAILAAVNVRQRGGFRALVVACAAVGYAILTRPLEGLLLVPAVAILVLPDKLSTQRVRDAKPAIAVLLAGAAAVAATLFVNYARFGDPLRFGYDADNGWVVPDLTRWAGVLVSPGRGLVWEFPAVLLVPIGALALVRSGKVRETLTIAVLSGLLLVNTTTWYMWWGGMCWGLRLFTPAIPLLASLAGGGVDRLSDRIRNPVAGVLLALGFFWALPGALLDINGGYGALVSNGKVWQLAAYPPYGAWQFLTQLRPETPLDSHAVDVLWVRLAASTGNWSLLVPVALLAAAAMLGVRSRRLLQREVAEARVRQSCEKKSSELSG